MPADEVQFFREQKGYERIFAAIYDRYRSLGRLGGTVTLTGLTPAERRVLSNHLRRDLSRQTKVSFGVQEFAASLQVTTDPHAFDLNSELGKMLVDALCTVLGLPNPKTREEINEVLYRTGLLVDELSNFVTCAGLMAYQGKETHPVWLAALETKEPLQVPPFEFKHHH